jgi:hypothetical protein
VRRGWLVAVAQAGTAATALGAATVGRTGSGEALVPARTSTTSAIWRASRPARTPRPPIAAVGRQHRRAKPHCSSSSSMSSTSCHLGRWCTPSGRRQAARRGAIAGSPQRSGRNNRQSSGQLACSVLALTDTPGWQVAVLPSVPESWRCTPTEGVPSLGKPVSSTTHAVGESAAVSTSARRRRTGRQSQGDTATKWCSAWSWTSPRRWAIGSIDLRRPSSSSPRREHRPRAR